MSRTERPAPKKSTATFGHRVSALRGARRARAVAQHDFQRLDPYARPEGRKLVVALSASSAQLPGLELTVRTLLDQTVRPSRIAVYLDSEVGEDQIDSGLLALVPFGVTITWAPESSRPAAALRLAAAEHPLANIVTVTVGRLYPADLLATLLHWHKRYPKAVIARRGMRMTLADAVQDVSCEPWRSGFSEGPSPRADAVPVGESGVLYPPQALAGRSLVDDPPTVPNASEDAWLKVQEIRRGVPCVVVPGAAGDVSVDEASDVSAAAADATEAMERTLRALFKSYGLTDRDLRETPGRKGALHLAWHEA